MNQSIKKSYTPPSLEQHTYTVVTGVSLPIGTNAFDQPFDMDFMDLEE